MKLIEATIKDAPTLLEIEKTTIGLKVYSGYFTEEEIRDEYLKNETVYLMENDGIIVGSISFEVKDDGHACVGGLVVKTEFQKQGFAKQAMSLLLEKLKNFRKLSLVVHPDNHAVKLYESFGFVVQSREENYFGDGEPRLIMTKIQ
jgi:[ribosomal protein S18]-alanine N-acetyltransferase